MEGKASFIILIAIVAFLSLCLALMGAYLFFGGSFPQSEKPPETEESTRPKDEELVKEMLFTEKKLFNLKSEDPNKSSFIQLNAEIVYFKQVSGIKKPGEKIAANKTNLRELVNTYFLKVSVEEVRTPEGREKIKQELVKKMNELLKANEESKNDIIYEIVFEDVYFQ